MSWREPNNPMRAFVSYLRFGAPVERYRCHGDKSKRVFSEANGGWADSVEKFGTIMKSVSALTLHTGLVDALFPGQGHQKLQAVLDKVSGALGVDGGFTVKAPKGTGTDSYVRIDFAKGNKLSDEGKRNFAAALALAVKEIAKQSNKDVPEEAIRVVAGNNRSFNVTDDFIQQRLVQAGQQGVLDKHVRNLVHVLSKGWVDGNGVTVQDLHDSVHELFGTQPATTHGHTGNAPGSGPSTSPQSNNPTTAPTQPNPVTSGGNPNNAQVTNAQPTSIPQSQTQQQRQQPNNPTTLNLRRTQPSSSAGNHLDPHELGNSIRAISVPVGFIRQIVTDHNLGTYQDKPEHGVYYFFELFRPLLAESGVNISGYKLRKVGDRQYVVAQLGRTGSNVSPEKLSWALAAMQGLVNKGLNVNKTPSSLSIHFDVQEPDGTVSMVPSTHFHNLNDATTHLTQTVGDELFLKFRDFLSIDDKDRGTKDQFDGTVSTLRSSLRRLADKGASALLSHVVNSVPSPQTTTGGNQPMNNLLKNTQKLAPSTQSLKSKQPPQPTQPTQSSQSPQPTQPTQPTQSSQSPQPTQPTQRRRTIRQSTPPPQSAAHTVFDQRAERSHVAASKRKLAGVHPADHFNHGIFVSHEYLGQHEGFEQVLRNIASNYSDVIQGFRRKRTRDGYVYEPVFHGHGDRSQDQKDVAARARSVMARLSATLAGFYDHVAQATGNHFGNNHLLVKVNGQRFDLGAPRQRFGVTQMAHLASDPHYNTAHHLWGQQMASDYLREREINRPFMDRVMWGVPGAVKRGAGRVLGGLSRVTGSVLSGLGNLLKRAGGGGEKSMALSPTQFARQVAKFQAKGGLRGNNPFGTVQGATSPANKPPAAPHLGAGRAPGVFPGAVSGVSNHTGLGGGHSDQGEPLQHWLTRQHTDQGSLLSHQVPVHYERPMGDTWGRGSGTVLPAQSHGGSDDISFSHAVRVPPTTRSAKGQRLLNQRYPALMFLAKRAGERVVLRQGKV